jgi:hypothetical protein
VPAWTQYIAAADFDRDGRADLIVNDGVSNEVTVLLSGADRQFKSLIGTVVGRNPAAIATGNLNGDQFPDIAVVAPANGRTVFYLYGKGDGTFTKPLSVSAGTLAQGVAIGNFDGRDNDDIAVSNLLNNLVVLLLNKGGGKGFSVQGVYPAGRGPKVLAPADLNGDGFDDLVATNTSSIPSSAGTVAVLLNSHGSFGSPTFYTVGPSPKSIGLGDFNGDGAPDIAVLNAGPSGTINVFSVSILLNQTRTVNGQKVGTGSFILEP